jgi:hypothetical protein
MFKFYLDGTELQHQPQGWKEFVAQINFNQEDKTLLTSYPNTLTFWGDGYTTIRELRNNDVCHVIPFIVEKECQEGYVEILNGLVNITAVKFNRTKCTAEVQIEDNSISARIRNNWEIKVNFTAERSKNDKPITRPSGIALDVFDPTDTSGGGFVSSDPGLFFRGGSRTAFDLKIAFDFLVAFVTDEILTFRSDWYDSLEDDEKICIVRGKELRWGSFKPSEDITTFPEISLKDLYDAVAKLYNLVMYVDGTELRIETLESIRNTTDIFTLENIMNVEEYFDQNVLYSKVNFGNQKFDKDGQYSEEILFITHNDEEYHVVGECNIGKDLDLRLNDVISDTNAIERTLIDGAGGSEDTLDKKYDDDTFIIMYSTLTDTAKRWNIIDFDSNGPWQYNRPLMNDAVANRYDLQGNLAKSISDVVLSDIAFEALSTDGDLYAPADPNPPIIPYTGLERQVVFDDIMLFNDDFDLGSDLGLQYGLPTAQGNNVPRANCKYQAIKEGVYVFEYDIALNITGDSNSNNEDELVVRFFRTNSFDTFITADGYTRFNNLHKSPFATEKLVPTTNNILFKSSFNTYLNVGDKVYVQFTLTSKSMVAKNFLGNDYNAFPLREYTFLPASKFYTLSTPALTFDFVSNVGTEYDYILYRFEKAIPNTYMLDLINNPTRKIIGTDDLGTFEGYVDDVTMNLATGQSTFQIRSRENLISL